MAGKLTPLQLRERHHLDLCTLAQTAKVFESVVYFMYLGQPVTREEAARVLSAISAITGVSYTLAEVEVTLLENDAAHELS